MIFISGIQQNLLGYEKPRFQKTGLGEFDLNKKDNKNAGPRLCSSSLFPPPQNKIKDILISEN